MRRDVVNVAFFPRSFVFPGIHFAKLTESFISKKYRLSFKIGKDTFLVEFLWGKRFQHFGHKKCMSPLDRTGKISICASPLSIRIPISVKFTSLGSFLGGIRSLFTSSLEFMKYTGQMRFPSRCIFIQKGVNQKEGVDEVMTYNFRFPGKYLIQYLTYLFESLRVF